MSLVNAFGKLNLEATQELVLAALQNLSVGKITISKDIDVSSYDLNAASYSNTITYTADALLGQLLIGFSTASPRDISIDINGIVIYSIADDISSDFQIDFEDKEIDTGDALTITIGQTSGACLADIELTSKVGTTSLVGSPSLAESTANIGRVDLWPTDRSPTGDAFSRIRTSEPRTQFEVHFQWDKAPLFVGTTADTTGILIHEAPKVILNADAGEIIKLRSHAYVTYQPGKSRLARLTAIFPDYVDSAIRLIGYGDDDDGVFLGRDIDGWFALLRSSTVGNITVRQADWNLDTLDGNGLSGITIVDWGAVHFVLDFEWLSLGRVRWGIEATGHPVYFHVIDFANQNENPSCFMRSGSLPVSWEIDATTVPSSSSSSDGFILDAICASVITEGGHEPTGLLWAAANQSAVPVTVSSSVPLLSIRPRLTFNGIVNHGLIHPGKISVLTNDDVLVEVYVSGTVTAASWTKVDATTSPSADGNSHTEYAYPSAFSGGFLVETFPVPGQAANSGIAGGLVLNDVLLYLTAAGLQIPLTICARKLAGNANVVASVQWVETD